MALVSQDISRGHTLNANRRQEGSSGGIGGRQCLKKEEGEGEGARM